MTAANQCIQYFYDLHHLAILFDSLNMEKKTFKVYINFLFADDQQNKKST
jgi:hypothetical protein